MLKALKLDVVHILLPPPYHVDSALVCARTDCDVFIEKPVATSAAECCHLAKTVEDLGRSVGVNHNALYHPAFIRLVHEIQECHLGEVQHVTSCLNLPLRQLEHRQHTHWMFQRPGNIIIEQAPHPIAQIRYLLGNLKVASALPSGETKLMTGAWFYHTWQISMICERGSAQCFLAFGRGYADSWLHVIGEDGTAFVDLRRNTIRLSEKTKFVEPVDHVFDSLKTTALTSSQGIKNFTDYAVSLVRLKPQTDPFFQSIRTSIMGFYGALSRGERPPVDLEQACAVIKGCEAIVESAAPWFVESRIEPTPDARR